MFNDVDDNRQVSWDSVVRELWKHLDIVSVWKEDNLDFSYTNWCKYCVNKVKKCYLLFYCASYRLNMFRALLCPSSGARDYNVGYHTGRFVLGLLYVGG